MSDTMHYINSPTEKIDGKERNSYTQSEKFIIGCKAVAGIPVAVISEGSGMSREYVYQQKEKVEAYVSSLDEPTKNEITIEVTKEFIERAVINLTLCCCSSMEGVQRFLECSFGITRSKSYISGVINKASERAQVFDDSIALEGIRQGANDEIFQGGTPILTGIDPESTYIYLLEEASDRTGETWQIYMQDCKDRGLQLETSINDSGSGLLSGIPKVYVDCHIIVSEKNRNRVSKYQDANHKPATQKQNKMTKRIKIT